MPIHKRAPAASQFIESPTLEGILVEIQADDTIPGFADHLPIQGEIIQSFEISDTPGGWHLVWLDQAFEFEGVAQAHLMIAGRWVARPIKEGSPVPIHIRLVPDVTLVELGAPDIEKLPLAGKGYVVVLDEESGDS